ncbi:MAG: hypothetical protein JWO11_3610 [Nocardioides sp.]|nr:hypothetical protein [Nocardioides sp.]
MITVGIRETIKTVSAGQWLGRRILETINLLAEAWHVDCNLDVM